MQSRTGVGDHRDGAGLLQRGRGAVRSRSVPDTSATAPRTATCASAPAVPASTTRKLPSTRLTGVRSVRRRGRERAQGNRSAVPRGEQALRLAEQPVGGDVRCAAGQAGRRPGVEAVEPSRRR